MNDFKMSYNPPELLNGTVQPIAYNPGQIWDSAGMRELFLLSMGAVACNLASREAFLICGRLPDGLQAWKSFYWKFLAH